MDPILIVGLVVTLAIVFCSAGAALWLMDHQGARYAQSLSAIDERAILALTTQLEADRGMFSEVIGQHATQLERQSIFLEATIKHLKDSAQIGGQPISLALKQLELGQEQLKQQNVDRMERVDSSRAQAGAPAPEMLAGASASFGANGAQARRVSAPQGFLNPLTNKFTR